jgi:hypothetical protein
MKKLIASAGLAALGTIGLQAEYAPGLSPVERSKPWNIGLSFRGFYDDNYATQTKPLKRASYGFSVSPSLGINLVLDQTLIGFNYTYDLRYYADRRNNTADHIHLANLKLSHKFSERYKADLTDNFTAAQEGTIDFGTVTTPKRLQTDANYIRNVARLGFDAAVTQQVGVHVGYENQIYDYQQTDANAPGGIGSRSSLLDRTEHLGTLEGRWQVQPNTTGIFGYKYGRVDHTGNGRFLSGDPANPVAKNSKSRDNTSHYVYAGGEQAFTSQLNGSIRLGAQFTDYSNANENHVTPYTDARLTWTYNPGSYLQLGVFHTLNQTDIAALDQESTVVFGSINHRVTPKLAASLLGQFQNSSFNKGFYDRRTDQLFLAGVNFNYQINPYLSFDAGYNYDRLDSEIGGRSYTRNRVFVGVRANY